MISIIQMENQMKRDGNSRKKDSYLQLGLVPPNLFQSRLECPDKHFPGSRKTWHMNTSITWEK